MRDGVATLAKTLSAQSESTREVAMRLHDYVRDTIAFGGTFRFDHASPLQTLTMRTGHCNPQSRLLVDMLKSVGIDARLHLVRINLEVLRGVVPSILLSRLSEGGQHACVEMDIEGRTVSVDSFIIDPPLYHVAKRLLQQEQMTAGYGIHMEGTNEWDGEHDAFCQLATPEMCLEDYGVIEDPDRFFNSRSNTNRIAGLPVSSWLRAVNLVLLGHLATVNRERLDRLRYG